MIRLHALGQCVFEVGEHQVTPDSDVLFAVLLLLTSKAGQPVPRADLLELLWPESDGNSARHRLRQAVYQLKKLGAPLATAESAIVVRKADVQVDYLLYRDDRDALTAFVSEPRRLDVLPRYAPGFSKPFARWVEHERDRVRATFRHHLLESVAAHRARGQHDHAIVLARACLELDALNEEAVFALAESLAIVDGAAAALSVVDQYRDSLRLLREEFPRSLGELRGRIVESAKHISRAASGHYELVGRTAIIQEIDAWVRERPSTRPTLVLMGDAGIGKTRLICEAARIAGVHGAGFVEYRSSANGEHRPLVGLLDLLPRLLALPGAVGCQPESYARLDGLVRGGHAGNSIPADTRESTFRFALLRRSVLDLFEAVLSEGDVILSLDDAHALDRPTLEILLDAVRLPGHGLAVIVALRPGGSTAAFLGMQADVRTIRVPRLEPEHARLVLTRGLPPGLVAQRTKLIDWAVDLADGNPFFLTELSAHCRTENPVASFPQSLQMALERKLDILSSTARLVLQACAVLAQNATLARLETMLALPPHAAATALSELEQAGLITSRDGWVGCRHDLIAETVVRTLGMSLGTYLHRRCAVVLDRELEQSPVPSVAWDCAQHWESANEPARALDLTRLIVDQLLSLGLPGPAADLCSRAERYCRSPRQQADRLLWLSGAQRLLYDWDGVVESLERRRSILLGLGPIPVKCSDDERSLTEARWWRDTNGQIIRPVLQQVISKDSPTLHRLQMAVLAMIVADNQHRRHQAEIVVAAVKSLNASTEREEAEKAKVELIYHTAFGSLDAAVVAGERIVAIERRGGNSAGLLKALRWSSNPLRLTDQRDRAMALLMEAFESASRLGLRAEMWNTSNYIQSIALDYEDLALASEWWPVFEELADDATVHALRVADYTFFSARIEYLRGELEHARALLDRALDLQTALPRVRGEQAILALDIMIRLGRDQKIPRRVLTRLHRLHLNSRDSGLRDFEAAALFAGLAATGLAKEAAGLLGEYLKVRRIRLPFQSGLASVIRMLAMDDPRL
jgi:DNA-binding SARP family transcriptional activator